MQDEPSQEEIKARDELKEILEKRNSTLSTTKKPKVSRIYEEVDEEWFKKKRGEPFTSDSEKQRIITSSLSGSDEMTTEKLLNMNDEEFCEYSKTHPTFSYMGVGVETSFLDKDSNIWSDYRLSFSINGRESAIYSLSQEQAEIFKRNAQFIIDELNYRYNLQN